MLVPRPPKTPADLVRRFAALRGRGRAEDSPKAKPGEPARADGWVRETHRLPREAAADVAREWFERYPKTAYGTEVESWKVLEDGRVEMTIRRLAAAPESGP